MSKFDDSTKKEAVSMPDKKTRTVEQLRARMEPVPIFSDDAVLTLVSQPESNSEDVTASDEQMDGPLVEVDAQDESAVVSIEEPKLAVQQVASATASQLSKEETPFFLKKNRANEVQKGNAPRETQKPEFPYPKNWNLGEVKMSEAHLVEVAETRRRNQELPTITLPTSEKTINEDLLSISVRADEDKISTVISVPTTNKGTIETREGVLVQGTQIGDIKIDLSDVEDKAGTVVISRSGTVRGDIEGKRVVVFGRVEGSIRSVTHITLAETAVVTGDIYYRKLRMMDGAEIEGNCQKLKEEEI